MEKSNREALRIELIELENEVAFRKDEIKELSAKEMDEDLKSYLDKTRSDLEKKETRLEYLRSIVKW